MPTASEIRRYLLDTRSTKDTGLTFVDKREKFDKFDWVSSNETPVQHIPLSGQDAMPGVVDRRLDEVFKDEEKVGLVVLLQVTPREGQPFTRVSSTSTSYKTYRLRQLTFEYRPGDSRYINGIITNKPKLLKRIIKARYKDFQAGKYDYPKDNIGMDCLYLQDDHLAQLVKIDSILY